MQYFSIASHQTKLRKSPQWCQAYQEVCRDFPIASCMANFAPGVIYSHIFSIVMCKNAINSS